MFFSSSSVAIFGLASLASAHMKMSSPTPYGASTLDNSPLLATGADFPCKQRSGVYATEGANNVMPLGSTQELAFIGSAVHGGGSCQVSITYDLQPTTSSVWKVIHSIEGGCPMKNIAGNNGDDASEVDPDTYSYTIPTTLPTGNATLAWTWFNKIGNREMYMNCAPISLTSGSSKRDELAERDTAAYDALPDMFVANVGNGCGTQDSTDLAFPNPGDSLEQDGTATATPSPPTGTCAKATGGSGSGSAATTAKVSAPAVTSAASNAGLSGGVFATVAPSAQTATAATSAAAVVAATPVASSVASAASPASTGTTSTSSTSGTSSSTGAMTAGSACSPEGLWNCIDGTSYQQCASGTWSVVMELAAGTTCSPGQSSAIQITASSKSKRSIRFSGEHLRRHVQQSS